MLQVSNMITLYMKQQTLKLKTSFLSLLAFSCRVYFSMVVFPERW